MRILLVLLAVVLIGVVGINVNGCVSDDAQPEVPEQTQDATDTADTPGAEDTTDTAGAEDAEGAEDATTDPKEQA